MLSSAIVARRFGAESFAIFTFVHVTATSLSNISMLGMLNGLPRFFARLEVDGSQAALAQALLSSMVVMAGLALTVGILGLIPSAVIGLPDPDKKWLLLLLTVSVGLNNVLAGVNNGFERFDKVALAGVTLGVLLLGGISIALLVDSPQIPLLAYLFATIVAAGFLAPGVVTRTAKMIAVRGIRFTGSDRGAVFAYVGPMLVATVMTNSGLWLAGRSLIRQEGGEYAFAEFAMGMQWFALAAMVSNVISRAVLPRLTRNAHVGDLLDQSRTLRSAVAFSVAGSIAVLVIVLLFLHLILSLYGKELSGGGPTLVLFVCSAVVASPVAVLSSALIAEARYRAILSTTAVWWLTVVVSSHLLRESGPFSITLAVFLAHLFQLLLLVDAHSRGGRG